MNLFAEKARKLSKLIKYAEKTKTFLTERGGHVTDTVSKDGTETGWTIVYRGVRFLVNVTHPTADTTVLVYYDPKHDEDAPEFHRNLEFAEIRPLVNRIVHKGVGYALYWEIGKSPEPF